MSNVQNSTAVMSGNPITIRSLGPEDANVLDRVRDGVFDNGIDPARLWALLATRINEVVVALDRGDVVGVAFGTVLMRPDKASEFFVNEVRLHRAYRGRGIRARLLGNLQDSARDRGCAGLWMLAERNDEDGLRLLRPFDGEDVGEFVMVRSDLS